MINKLFCLDHNPDKPTKYHMEANDFINSFPDNNFDGALFDPPYSYRQVSEHYKVIGKKATQFCCGWNSNGVGVKNGFELIEVLMVPHGGHHNDTIVTVERKFTNSLF